MLKPGREEVLTSIDWFINEISGESTTRMERGGIVCAKTTASGTGEAMDSAAQAVEYAANPSGRAAVGLLLIDFVNLDLSRQQRNQYKEEAQIGTKAVLLRQGWVVTNRIVSGSATGTTPITAYCGPTGYLTVTNPGGYPTVGQFLSRVDSDGYAKVAISLI